MRTRELAVAGGFEFTPDVFSDHRGFFTSPFQESRFAEAMGAPLFPVAQVSHSRSRFGVLRGVHYTATPPGGAKYVQCLRGQVRDFIVDLRIGSPTFGQHESVLLDETSCRAVYCPVGVGHAFLALAEGSTVVYLLSGEYVADNERAVSPLDPELGLDVPPASELLQSARDADARTVREARASGSLPEYATCLTAEAALLRG